MSCCDITAILLPPTPLSSCGACDTRPYDPLALTCNAARCTWADPIHDANPREALQPAGAIAGGCRLHYSARSLDRMEEVRMEQALTAYRTAGRMLR